LGLIDDLLAHAGVDARPDGSLRLVDDADLDAVLDAAAARGVRILGIEGFRRLGDDDVQPEMDAILDLSELSDPAESVREARRFHAAIDMPDLAYDLSVTAPEES
jgi:hypothetical protein